ncbi:hypothetical protein [Fibrella aquatilis]|uniref:Antitoxin n=1 Tax=Fibrella aquatilis TaxID=2817059 RepID=A0A939GA05_9BACT|nr:hypothetical protein [Fibrella aquatilis]MBO0932822.1 hypothetical protein [Fibrella aquatilis]
MKPQFITDDKGNRTAVILPITDYNKLLDELDEQDTVRMYAKAKEEKLTFRPLSEALADIDAKRQKRRVSGKT